MTFEQPDSYRRISSSGQMGFGVEARAVDGWVFHFADNDVNEIDGDPQS